MELEALTLPLAEEHAASTWTDLTDEVATTAFLVAAGVAPQTAAHCARPILHESVERRERR
ncbi:hypothetical protein ACGF3G_10710 [Streptomyces sp. NPDC048179]|uniref:hypothetical protein n=1 Tax=Streptomyces sp. NPDC048179 TaxID=3365506 RepID=UPI003718C68A